MKDECINRRVSIFKTSTHLLLKLEISSSFRHVHQTTNRPLLHCSPTARASVLMSNQSLSPPLNLELWKTQSFEVAQTHHEVRSEEHTSELQSHVNLVCRLLLEKK